MAPVITAMEESGQFTVVKCVTAQHREMLDQVLKLFEISPDYDLDIMKPGQSLSSLTADVITGMQNVIDETRPQIILVQGDTTTTMATALAAFYSGVRLAHVEAGLRTYNIHSPWPEEANRRITSVLTDIHFAPTERAKSNLLNEGVPKESILVTGNTVIDSLQIVSNKLKNDKLVLSEARVSIPILKDDKKLILVTCHRRESKGTGFEQICAALKTIGRRQDVQIIFSVHPSPNVSDTVYRLLSDEPNIDLIEPLDYLPFVYLLLSCSFVLTDSGGIQEEAPSFGKPVLVLRDTTERQEAIEAGTAMLVGTNPSTIVRNAVRLLNDSSRMRAPNRMKNPFGDGKASERIRFYLEQCLIEA